jgi:hypothetical protein
MSKGYFEIVYQGPFKGVNTALPEDVIGREYSPYISNFILKNGELRTRPNQNGNILPPPPDGGVIDIITSFMDSNNVIHTVAVTNTGLWQLNTNWNKNPRTSRKTWQLVGQYPILPGTNIPAASSVFVNKFFWTNGGTNLWVWDGISSIGSPSIWKPSTSYISGAVILDSNGNLQVAGNTGISAVTVTTWANTLGAQTIDNANGTITQDNTTIVWTENGKPAPANGFSAAAVVDATNGYTSGAFFLIELNSQLIMLNTVETTGRYTQRIRWSPSGIPTIWDPNVNIGAGFVDELDVADAITGAFTVGTTAFILRTNGITEMLSNSGSGENPFSFNHLWASDRGIGNTLPFGYASFGPIGIFISLDDIYNVSLGGFKKIGGVARDAIYNDIAQATFYPIGSIVPYYTPSYVYNHYKLCIPQGQNSVTWIYSIEDDSWTREYKSNCNFTGQTRWSYVS